MNNMKKINVITLGCSKNTVDSEHLAAQLADAGYEIVFDSDRTRSDVVVINTCGFIGDAKKESIDTILAAAAAKQQGLVGELFVIGCLSERYADELRAELPEVDDFFGVKNWEQIVERLGARHRRELETRRMLSTPSHYAYLKIAEGCDRMCGYCAIPLIRGRYVSRPIEELVEEATALAESGVRELIVIAQDTTCYGIDLYGRRALAELLERLCRIDKIRRIRLHYAYPTDFPRDLLRVMAERENVCSYLDIALQHISDPVLSNMRRHITGAQTRDLIAEMRATVPDLHLRTTLMVGFPGEGDKEFDELMEFVAQTRFERMGAFAYCEEDDTYAAKHLPDNIPGDVKAQRLDRLMALQESISLDIQENKIGQTFKVIIDREEADYYVGRTQWDSPEVDPEVLVEKDRRLNSGDFVNVTITSAMPFELIGKANG